MVIYTEEEKEFVKAIYLVNREEREPWRTVVSRFRERFGRSLGQGQLRYLRLRYVFPNGQADDPRYRNRRRGKKLEARAAAAAKAEEASDQGESSAQDCDMNAYLTPSPGNSPAPSQSSQTLFDIRPAQGGARQTAAMFNQPLSGGPTYHDSSFPMTGREHLQSQYGSAPLSGQGYAQRQHGSFSSSSGQGHVQDHGSFSPPLGGQGQIQGHRSSFPPPSGQGNAQGQRVSFSPVSVQARQFQEQHGFFPPPPTEYGQINGQENFWTPPMTPTYPPILERYHVPRYPVGPVPNLAPNGQNILPTEVDYTDVHAYPEPDSFFRTGLEDWVVHDWRNTAIPDDLVNPGGTVPGNPLEQPVPSDVQPVLPLTNQQIYDDYEGRFLAMDPAQAPWSDQGKTDADADEDTGLAEEDIHDERLEVFMERWARELADQQQPEADVPGLVGETEEGFDGEEFERDMAESARRSETPQLAGTTTQSPEIHAQLEKGTENADSKKDDK